MSGKKEIGTIFEYRHSTCNFGSDLYDNLMRRWLLLFLILCLPVISASAEDNEYVADNFRPKTKDWFNYCMSHRDYEIDIYELDAAAFVSDLDGDSRFDVKVKPSCNFSRRMDEKNIKGIVIHYTNGDSEGSYSWFQTRYPGTSAHYIIDRDGTIIQAVPEAYTAYHIGCYWDEDNCSLCPDSLCDNSGYFTDPIETTIAIELENSGPVFEQEDGSFINVFHRKLEKNFGIYFYYGSDPRYKASRYYQSYTEAQLKTLSDLIDSIETRYGHEMIIVGHDEIQQSSLDPGPAFPRERFLRYETADSD